MARASRIEYDGALYHVLNRGNYRQELFTAGQAGRHFEQTLLETCARFGWRLHAYVIMSNHYHLALETPEANLTTGMQWLQSSFANRFNRVAGERGHVFQGRFKSLVVEEGPALLAVVNYIHLNPVRAGLVDVTHLREYELSSFPKYLQRKDRRPGCLCGDSWLWEAGHLRPTPGGMRCYQEYLAFQEEADPANRQGLHQRLCRGWYIGTQQGKEAFLGRWMARGGVKEGLAARQYGTDAALVLRARGLSQFGKKVSDLEQDHKGAAWKVILACWIKAQTGVSNRWLSEHLHLGATASVSRLLQNERHTHDAHNPLWRKLQ